MSNIVNLNDFKNYRIENNVNTDFMKALDRLSKQNGLDYEKMLLGNKNEKKQKKKSFI